MKKEIYKPLKSDPVKLIKGRYLNTITGRYVSLNVAKRYNSYFKRNPKGTVHQSWGGAKFQRHRYDPETKREEYLGVTEQPKIIQKLWDKSHQYIKTKDKRGKEILYSPFAKEFLTDKQKKIIDKLDYSILDGLIMIHLHRLTRDGLRVYHILTYRSDKILKNEMECRNFFAYMMNKITPRLEKELKTIKKYHSFSRDNVVFGQMEVTVHLNADHITTGGKFPATRGHYIFNNEGIERTLAGMIDKIGDYLQSVENKTYLSICFEKITIYVMDHADDETKKYAKFRYGVQRMEG